VAVQASLGFNYGEFAIIKVGIVDALPYSKKLDSIAVSQPIRNIKITVLRFQHIAQRNVFFISQG
jgi:hypothetical protein